MAIVLPKKGGFGESLGSAAGYGLQNLLQGLGTGLEQRGQAKGLERGGLPAVLALLDPQVQASYLREYGSAQQAGKQNALLDTLLSAGQPGSSQGSIREAINSQLGLPEESQSSRQNPVVTEMPAYEQQAARNVSPERRLKQELDKLNMGLSREDINPNQKNFLRSEIEKRENALSKYVQQTNKATQPFYDEISAFKEAADLSDKRLNRMTELVNKGKLPNSALYSTLKSIEDKVSPGAGAAAGAVIGGLAGAPAGPIGSLAGRGLGAGIGAAIGGLISPVATLLKQGQKLINTDTDEFEKLSNDFIREAKNIFGSRITDADLKTFMSLVPTLENTDEGKKAIIRNLKNFNAASRIKYKTLRQIIRENDGLRPLDLREQVEDRSRSQLDKLSKRFISGEDMQKEG